MAQKLHFYPLGNAETCLLELENGRKLLFDYAEMYNGSEDDYRYDIRKELSSIKEFDVVMFSHAHDDHTHGASSFFYLDHAKKYQSNERAKIKELWVSAAFLLDTDLDKQSDAKIIREEARYRFKNGYGIKVFAAPDSLTEWMEKQKISKESVSNLIVCAGSIMPLSDKLREELQIFVHAPFSDDSESVQDKNDPSIVLQVRLYNGGRNSNIIFTGDTPYKVLDKIVDTTRNKNHDEYLNWDIYDIPHHCSYTGLNEKPEDNILVPSDKIKWLLQQACKNAYMIASCERITEKTSPPHMCAKSAYENSTSQDVSFWATMEHARSETERPTPIRFEIDSMGVTLKRDDLQEVYFRKSAPRAGSN